MPKEKTDFRELLRLELTTRLPDLFARLDQINKPVEYVKAFTTLINHVLPKLQEDFTKNDMVLPSLQFSIIKGQLTPEQIKAAKFKNQ